MVTMTNGRMAHLLSIDTHRKGYPVVRWIEENIQSGKANTDYDLSCKDVIEEVSVKLEGTFEYEVLDGKITQVITGWKAEPFFEDPKRPTRKEIDLLEVCDPMGYNMLKEMCHEILVALDRPHSCSIEYLIIEDMCQGAGCDKIGPVNYLHGGKDWRYFCGGSPRCCP